MSSIGRVFGCSLIVRPKGLAHYQESGKSSRRDAIRLAGAAGALGLFGFSALAQDQIPVPLPRVARFERMGFGLFVHWGLYSQLGRGEWVMNREKLQTADLRKLMSTFTASDFSGRAIARLAKRAGAKYVTLTTRHHEGFSLYDTKGLSDFDVMHTPAKRDLIADFVAGCRAEGIVPMFYCTTLDWTEPRFNSDFPAYLEYLRKSVELLCTRYGPIGGYWFDGNWSKKGADWQEDRLYSMIRKHQPEAMIINNTGIDAMGRAGNPEVDSVTFERGRPQALDRRGHRKYLAAEMCHTMNFHWGVANKDFNYLSPAHVIEELCFARRAGANLLMNFGPTGTGGIPEYEGAALGRVGEWIKMHGGDQGVIYNGLPCAIKGDKDDFALTLGDDVYLFVTGLTATSNTRVHDKSSAGPGPRFFGNFPAGYGEARWMDNGELVKTEYDAGGKKLTLRATAYPYGTNTVIRVARLKRKVGA